MKIANLFQRYTVRELLAELGKIMMIPFFLIDDAFLVNSIFISPF